MHLIPKNLQQPQGSEAAPLRPASQWRIFLADSIYSAFFDGIGTGRGTVEGSRYYIMAPLYSLRPLCTRIACISRLSDMLLSPRHHLKKYGYVSDDLTQIVAGNFARLRRF